ncbi:MAG: glycosyltransferase [Bdellovibrionales bacterium]|nr:glycosyltransferase [Bdellovibrionales bacterium]
MRILFTADPELPVPPIHYGGVQRLVAQVAEQMRSRGHTVGLIAHPDSTAKVDAIYSFPGRASQNRIDTVRNCLALHQAVKHFSPDILHSYSRLMYMIPLLGQNLQKIMSYGRSPGTRQVYWANFLFPNTLTFTGCSKHITNSGRVGGGKWHIIYNSIDLDDFSYVDSVQDDAPLVFLSRLERIKGVHTAIKIAQHAQRKLIIAGNTIESGPSAKYFEEEIKPQIDGQQISYIGPVDNKQRNELLGQARCLLVPIEWEEPYGLVFAEALACGTPVISTARGAVPEIIRNNIEGILIESIEDGVNAVNHIHTLERAACRKRVEELFSLPTIATQYENLYKALLIK